MKYVPPTVRETAFNCPHCFALTTQTWHSLLAKVNASENRLPRIISPELRESLKFEEVQNIEFRKKMKRWADTMAQGRPFLHVEEREQWTALILCNVSLSKCFNCGEVSIWIFDKLVYPQRGEAPVPTPDLSNEVRRDYDEASSILDLSPRGAAALMRLAIQKLCKELGQPGDNLNDDIGALVAAGLDARIQKSLDSVRVIGNNAVHPGQIDLRDDRATAEILFRLLNLIAERMISEPKHVDEVYAALPEDARKAIEKRDAKN